MPEIDRCDGVEAEVKLVIQTREWLKANYERCPLDNGKCPVCMTDTAEIKEHTQFFCTNGESRRIARCDHK